MATRFWVGGAGTSDGVSTTHWAATSGGASGASAPTILDDVTFDANSGMPAAIVLAAGTTCNNLTVTGPASKTQVFTLSANLAPAGAVAVNGNSVINRVLFQSSVPGVARTITVNTPFAFTLSNIDFMDITGAGTASPFAGTSIGDCLGNSGITFAASVTQTATGTASFTWSTHGWTTRVPLPQDDVVINNAFIAGRTVTVDMPRIGRNIDLSGATGAPTWTAAAAVASFGDVKLGASWTMTSGSTVWTLSGRGSQTITTNGIGTGNAIGINTPGGTYSLQDDMLVGSTATKRGINHGQGTLTTNDHAVTCGTFVQNSLSSTRVNNWGASTVTITGTGNVLFIGGSGSTTTWNAGTSTFSLTNTTGTAANISSTQTFNHITLAASGAFAFTANTVIGGNLTVGALATVTMTAGITLTFTSTGAFVPLGTAGNLPVFKSSIAGTAWSISKASGNVTCDFISLQDSHAIGGAGWFAGHNSVNVSGNTGWIFGDLQLSSSTLSGLSGETIGGIRLALGSSSLASISTISIDATKLLFVVVGISGSSNINISGSLLASGILSLGGISGQQVDGLRIAIGSSSIFGMSGLDSNGLNTKFGNISLIGVSGMTIDGIREIFGIGVLSGMSGMVIETEAIFLGSSSLHALTEMSTSATKTLIGDILLLGRGSLSVNGIEFRARTHIIDVINYLETKGSQDPSDIKITYKNNVINYVK